MKILYAFLATLFLAGQLGAQLSQFEVLHRFESVPAAPWVGAVKTSAGKMLVVTGGGRNEAGCIAEVPESGGSLIKLADLASIGGSIKVPVFFSLNLTGVALDAADNLYGTASGGSSGGGLLWRWSSAGGLEVVHDFSGGTLSSPINNVVSDGTAVYGSCSAGGANGFGGLWKWTEAGGIETVRSHEGTFTYLPKGLAFRDGVIYGISGETFSGQYSAHLWKLTPAGVYTRVKVHALSGKSPNGMIIPYNGGMVWGAISNATDVYGLHVCDLYVTTSAGVVTLLQNQIERTSLSGAGGILSGGGDIAAGLFSGSHYIPASKDYIWKLTSASGFQIEEVAYPVEFWYPNSAPSGQLILGENGLTGVRFAGVSEVNYDGTYQDLAWFPSADYGQWLTGIAVDAAGSVFTSVFHGRRTLRWNRAQPDKPEIIAQDYTGGIPAGTAMLDAAGNFFTYDLEPWAIGKITPSGVASVVSSFDQFSEATMGYSSVRDKAGNFYGTVYLTLADSTTQTKLWRCTPSGKVSIMATLNPAIHGTDFTYALTIGPDGTVYGATNTGGLHNEGTLWKWSSSTGLKLIQSFEAFEDKIDGGLAVLPDGTLIGIDFYGEEIDIFAPNGSIIGLQIPQSLQGAITQHCMAAGHDGRLYVLSRSGGSASLGALWRLNESSGAYAIEILHEMSRDEMPCHDYSQITAAPDGSIYGTGTDGVWRYGPPLPALQPDFAQVLAPKELRSWMARLSGLVNAPAGVTKVEFLLGTSAKALNQVLPVSPLPDTTSGDAVEVSFNAAGLKAKTTYYCQMRFTGAGGAVFTNSIKAFVTPAADSFAAATAETGAATGLTSTTAMLSGTMSSRFGAQVIGNFVFGLSPTSMTQVVETTPGFVVSGFEGPVSAVVTAALSGLKPHTRYFYQLVASDGNSDARGVISSFVTQNTLPVASADALSFVPGVKCVLPVLLNDVDADADTLKIKSISGWNITDGKLERQDGQFILTSAGGYTGGTFSYTITDGAGGENTASVTLTPATVQLMPPSGTVPAAGGVLLLTVTTLASWAVEEKSSWLVVTPLTGNGNGSVQVVASPNTGVSARSAQVKVGDQVFSVTQEGQSTPLFGAIGVVPLASAGTWFQLPIPIINPPVTYTVTGLPPGLKINPLTHMIEGYPNKPQAVPYSVTINAANKAGHTKIAPLAFSIVVNEPQAAVQGSYHAHITGGALNADIGGQLSINLTSQGSMTGSLINGTSTYRLSGPVDTGSGAAAENADGWFDSIIRQKGAPDLRLKLRFQPGSQADLLDGVLTRPDGSQSLSIAGGKLAGPADVAPFNDNQFQVFLQPSGAAANLQPQGTGALRLKVGNNGSLNWQGSLADGTMIIASGSLRKSGLAPLHIVYTKGAGSASGLIQLTADSGPNGNHTVGGSVRWIRKPSTTRIYASGFLQSAAVVSGHRYRAPAIGALSLGAAIAVPPAFNATLTFSGAGLHLAGQRGWETQACRIQEVGLPVLDTLAAVNPVGLKFTVYDRTNGVFNGSFTLTDRIGKRVVKFSGLLDEAGRAGKGWFLLPQLPLNPTQSVTNTPMQSGNLSLLPDN